MDAFMDKLAQKLTAQEMIKANTAAETEEMNKMKNRIKEYNDCLDKLQKLIEEGTTKLEGAKVDGGEINRLVEESIAKIQQMRQDPQVLEALQEQLNEKLENSNENMHKECVKVYRNVQAVVVEESGKQTESLDNMSGTVKKLQGRLNAVFGISIAALAFAFGGVVLQVISMLNIKFF